MRPATYVLSAAMVAVGVLMVVRTLGGGGGPTALGLVLGLLFCAAGIGRIYAERRRRP